MGYLLSCPLHSHQFHTELLLDQIRPHWLCSQPPLYHLTRHHYKLWHLLHHFQRPAVKRPRILVEFELTNFDFSNALCIIKCITS